MATTPTSANPVVLGGVTFTTFEAPSKFPIGNGGGSVVQTKLSGGGLVTNVNGAFPGEVTWEGMLWNPTADARRDLIRSYMVDQLERLITWKTERFYCIVKDFTATAIGGRGYSYSITLAITRDANGSFSSTSGATIDQQVAALTSTASLAAANIATYDPSISTTQIAITNANQSISNAGPLSQASSASIATVTSSLATALAAANQYLAVQSPTSTSLVPANQIVNSLSLAQATVAAGATQKTITVQGGSTDELASTFSGDPSLGSEYAAFNGLVSTDLSTSVPTTLRIPPLVSTL